MKLMSVVAAVVLAATLAGCTRVVGMLPPSKEKSEHERAVDENARLEEALETTTQLNRKLSYELEITRIELQKARAALAGRGAEPVEEVRAFQDYEVHHIGLGLLTGLSNWDEKPGIDGFKVYLLAKDSEGTTLKRKGNCVFDLINISRRKETVIMSWALPAETLGASWQSLPPGYRITLPWQGDAPWGDEVVLRATFTNAYGSQFTTSAVFTLEDEPGDEAAGSDAEGAQ